MSNNNEPQLTHHAMLIAWGQFAQCIGLTEQLSGVPIKQKTVDHSPQSKILEFLVANLAGLAHLKDISHAAHPLDQDLAVAQAWGLTSWADYSGVSRTLTGLKPEEVDKVLNVLAHISQPCMDREAALAIRQEGRLVLDGDLSGRTVSDTSRTYPGVAYGHMDDQVHLGYQAALVCLHSPTYGRLWLSVSQHPGDTVSCTEAGPMIRRSEAILGLYPLRRVDLLRKRLEALESRQKDLKDVLEKARQSLDEAHQDCDEGIRQVSNLEKIVLEIEETYQKQQRKVRPHSQLSQQRARLTYYQQRQKRRDTALIQAEKRLARNQKDLQAWQTEVDQLRQRLEQFEHDNQSNTTPIQAIFRLDAGFGTAENIALLIEMGYEVYSKPHGNWLTGRLKSWITEQSQWERVGKNAVMVAWPAKVLPDFPYPLDLAMERFQTGAKLKLGGLIHYGKDQAATHLPGWFECYNARQTIEAGNKEEKQVFELHHLKIRSRSGILLQEYFVAFAANFVRWATLWLKEDCAAIPDGWLDPAQPRIKEQVRVGANSSAWVSWHEQGCLLRFDDHSIFVGRSLQLKKQWSFQLVLPFAKSCFFSEISDFSR
jgi:hypothetical protein